eukprot:gene320-biopygen225
MSGKRRDISDSTLLGLLASHPLLTLKVTLAIHWHALRLVLKRIPFFPHPAPVEPNVTLGREAPAAPSAAIGSSPT